MSSGPGPRPSLRRNFRAPLNSFELFKFTKLFDVEQRHRMQTTPRKDPMLLQFCLHNTPGLEILFSLSLDDRSARGRCGSVSSPLECCQIDKIRWVRQHPIELSHIESLYIFRNLTRLDVFIRKHTYTHVLYVLTRSTVTVWDSGLVRCTLAAPTPLIT